MNLLLGLGSSLFTNPLIRGALGSFATGAVSTLKSLATQALGGAVSGLTSTLVGAGQSAQSKIDSFKGPDWARPYGEDEEVTEKRRRPQKVRRRPVDNDTEYSRFNTKKKRTKRVPYDPDLITDFE